MIFGLVLDIFVMVSKEHMICDHFGHFLQWFCFQHCLERSLVDEEVVELPWLMSLITLYVICLHHLLHFFFAIGDRSNTHECLGN